jgi:hypothetical protein
MHPLSNAVPAHTAPLVPNVPAVPVLAVGAAGHLWVTWTTPVTDSAHGAPATFNLRWSLSGAGNWTVLTGVASPYDLGGLAVNTAMDVQVQGANAGGASAWSPTATQSTAAGVPNAPSAPVLGQGAGTNLTVVWTAPATDSAHSAATGSNLRWSLAGAGNWTTVANVSSPYALTGLPAASAIDVAVQGSNAAGLGAWSAVATMTTAAAGAYAPNAPQVAGVAPPADGTVTKLAVTWTAPATDGTHGAATGYTLRYGPAGAGTWTTVANVTSPYVITGLSGATAIDVQVQGTNAAASPSAWSAIATGTTWGATIAQGPWTAAASQVHGTGVAPNGGVNLFAVAAPTAVTGVAFAWSTSGTVIPTSGLVAAAGIGQANGWGQYFNAPATAGTYYLWMLAQGAGGATTGAMVSSAITTT